MHRCCAGWCLRPQGMHVVVEPQDYSLLRRRGTLSHYVDTYDEGAHCLLARHVDFVVCLGGDGLILHAAYLFGKSIPPIIRCACQGGLPPLRLAVRQVAAAAPAG